MIKTGYFKIGDWVLLQGKNAPQLEVTGFRPHCVGRLSAYCGLLPGVYASQQHIAVRTPDGLQCGDYYCHTALVHADPSVEATRCEREQQPQPVRVGDLPDTEFWEGDIVTWREKAYFVVATDYAQLVTGTAAPEPQMDVYVVSEDPLPRLIHNGAQGGRALRGTDAMHLTEQQLTLVTRGNAWRQAADEPLAFSSPEEEVYWLLATGAFENLGEVCTSDDATRYKQNDATHGMFAIGEYVLTQHVYAVCLKGASPEALAHFRKESFAWGHNTPAFVLP